jgi:thiamine pyrophosphokinase
MRRLAEAHDLLLAADGAAHRLIEAGLKPDLVCGDFDSVQMEAARAALPTSEFIPTPDQDRADLEKAVQVARERGATSITITGATGGRIDHTLANFALLLRYHREIPLCIREERASVWAISGAHSLAAAPGDTISLLSLDGLARVTIRGVQWPLENYPLPIGTMGISNVATEERVHVLAQDGALLLCHLPH